MKIKEAIIVEGKDDIAAVKAAVDAEVIATGGIRISQDRLDTIKQINDRCGIIILTDPDYAGQMIRKKLAGACPGAKHAFISQDQARKDQDIGVENASQEAIIQALERSRAIFLDKKDVFSRADLVQAGLEGGPGSKKKRERLAELLGIGYANSKQLLNRLNSFGVSREEFTRALAQIEEEEDG